MEEHKADKIIIRNLHCRCIIGMNDWERREKQDVVLNIILWIDLSKACRTDSIEDTMDYKELKKQILRKVESSSFSLIERLAALIVDICLERPQVQKVKVTLDKPGALRFADSVAVEMIRMSSDDDPQL